MSLINSAKLLFIAAVAVACFSCSPVKRTVTAQNAGVNNDQPVVAPVPVVVAPPKPVLRKRDPYILVSPPDSTARKYAAILGVKKADIQNGRLYSFIDHWAGTPYVFGGLEHSGIDCSGFVYLIQQEVYDICDMPRSTNLQINYIKRKYENELKEGDLVFFDFDGKQFSHVGIYLMNGYVIHASSSRGVTISRLHSPSLYKYFSRAGSVIDPADAAAEQTAD